MSNPFLAKSYKKKRASKKPMKKRVYKKKAFRKAKDVPDLASLSVKRSMQFPQPAPAPPGPGATVNTLYNLMNTQLIDYQRAVQVAAAYQHYRIKKISVTFKPSYDTFGAGSNTTKPNLYWMIDKSGSVPTNANLEALKQMGAKPIQLDEKNITISWRPSVLESAMYAGGGAGASSASKYRISPWLTTTANNVSPGVFIASGIDHLGLYWYVDQSIPNGYQYTCEVEVQFQFKKPLINLLAGVEAIPAQVATLNESPDGVVGGGDGI